MVCPAVAIEHSGRNIPKIERTRTMKDIYDFGEKLAHTYTGKCECGKIIELSTQADNNAEYITNVFVRCACGKSVEFAIPVN